MTTCSCILLVVFNPMGTQVTLSAEKTDMTVFLIREFANELPNLFVSVVSCVLGQSAPVPWPQPIGFRTGRLSFRSFRSFGSLHNRNSLRAERLRKDLKDLNDIKDVDDCKRNVDVRSDAAVSSKPPYQKTPGIGIQKQSIRRGRRGAPTSYV